MLRQQQKGFTLIELMITIAILAIIMSLAVPSMSDFFDRKRLIKGAEAVYEELQFARSHAIASSTDTSVVFNRAGDEDWTIAVNVASGCTPANVTTPGNCYIVVDDGDGIVDGVDINLNGAIDAGEVDTGDRISRKLRHDAATAADNNYPGALLKKIDFAGGSETVFNSIRGTATSGYVQLQSGDGYQMIVQLNALGRLRICSPAGAAVHVSPYNSTSCTWVP
jgi:type IV fimbrial biogenesis protein FimT